MLNMFWACVVVPRLIERDSPTAVHRHGIVERAGGGDVRLGDGDSPGSNRNLRIRGKGDPLDIVERQRRSGGLWLVMLFEQSRNNCQAIGLA